MFFILSKAVWAVFSPLNFILLLFLLGMFLFFFNKMRNFASLLTKISVILFVVLSIVPVGYNLQVLFDKQYPPAKLSEQKDYAGIIILGGCIHSKSSSIYGIPNINGSCERLLEGIKLHNKFPELPVIYTGGSGSVFNQEFKEADIAKQLMSDLGVDTNNVMFERDSRNTYENMSFSKRMAGDLVSNPWILITSASHMYRAERVFCHGGWNVLPFPVDYNTHSEYDFSFRSPLSNFEYLNRVSKELLGIVAYGVSGKLSMNSYAKTLK